MNNYIKENIDRFNKIRRESPLCRLLLKDREVFSKNFDGADLYSIAFVFFCRKYISDIDTILKKFNIEEKATKSFKGNLEERWLDEYDDRRRLQSSNRVLSSLAELSVANHLSINGEEIIQLSALSDECLSDIRSYDKSIGREYFTEVKYLGEIPDENQLVLQAMRTGRPAVNFISPPAKIYNYYCIRIADAVLQLEKNDITCANRRIFLVISSLSRHLVEHTAIAWLINRSDWIKDCTLDTLVSELSLDTRRITYFNNSVDTYINRGNKVVIAFVEKSNIQVFRTIDHAP